MLSTLKRLDLSKLVPLFLYYINPHLHVRSHGAPLRFSFNSMLCVYLQRVGDNTLDNLIPTELKKLTNLEQFSVKNNPLGGQMDPIFCDNGLQILEADCLSINLGCTCCTLCCDDGGTNCQSM